MEPDHTPGPPKKKKIGTSTTKYTLIYTIYCGRARYDYHEGIMKGGGGGGARNRTKTRSGFTIVKRLVLKLAKEFLGGFLDQFELRKPRVNARQIEPIAGQFLTLDQL